jgi:hypothetical protein
LGEERGAIAGGRKTAAAARRPRTAQLCVAVDRTRPRNPRGLSSRRSAACTSRRRVVRSRCVLHWAEGDKTRNSVRIASSDPELLALFVEFLRIHFGVRNDQITIYCNLFADHIERQVEIETFWLTKLGLPPTALRKSVINNYSKHSKKKRKNKLPWGTCKVCVHSSRIQQTILGSIQEYGGFERPEWLD